MKSLLLKFNNSKRDEFVKEIDVLITLLDGNVSVPQYASTGASGADVRANIAEPVIIASMATALIPTGIKLAIPEGYEIQVRSRSGLAFKNQIMVLNSPGTVDSDYRGEICVILMNLGQSPFTVEPGMRIAQIILCPIVKANFIPIAQLPQDSIRGEKGFGHTGLK
ncbi:MAG: deoxyuridine 5-triphosphate nucleotidohydrolase [Chlamydiales bacterium]|jgi:dUTP pyrophosphatase|nr:deoxyuridine 5-triphosphate nucleotidohydrolase [Chlamydiales bacterium]